MIIGNGLVANSFKKNKNFFKNTIIFASGLANSQNKNQSEFTREKKLLKKFLLTKKKLIYFSTLDVFRKKKTAYIKHKINVENVLKKNKNILIIRLPQLIGKSNNKYTIFNFLNFNLRINKSIRIFVNYYRNFIDVNDLVFHVKKLNKKKINFKIINIYNKRSIKINYLLKIFKNEGVIKNKIIKFDKTNDFFFKKMSKFRNNKYIVISKKNYYKKLFKKYIQ